MMAMRGARVIQSFLCGQCRRIWRRQARSCRRTTTLGHSGQAPAIADVQHWGARISVSGSRSAGAASKSERDGLSLRRRALAGLS